MANLKKLKKIYGDDLLWSGKKCICGLPISFTRYILTSTVLYTRVGFLSVKEDEIELYKIVDKVMEFPLGQRIVGCGTINLTSKDSDTPQKLLKAIKKPREVKRVLDEAVKVQRDKYLIRGRDMVGAASDIHDHDDDNDNDN
ncbi:MAG: PH domain-containing protein [Ruminococcaceae bacterium]|nr:PH domain-containing protein [Oscillospiraceae bacterium]